MNSLTKEQYLQMYYLLTLTRQTELFVQEYYKTHITPENPHLSLGEEALSIGLVYPLRKDDQILPALRSRGQFLVKGIPLKYMLTGLLGKDEPYSHGKSPSHHIGVPELGVLLGTASVSSNYPYAMGAAFAMKMQKKDSVVMVFTGDGGMGYGGVYEAMNLAGVKKLPIIFVVENNLYSISEPIATYSSVEDIYLRGEGFGMPGIKVNGQDVMACYNASVTAIERARAGEGPTLIECKTYRYCNHDEALEIDFRPPAEIAWWEEPDREPVAVYTKYLLDNGYAVQAELNNLQAKAATEIASAIEYAESQPDPDPQSIFTNVYANSEVKK